MKKNIILLILMIIISISLYSQENKISFYNIFILTFDNSLILEKVGESIFTYQNDENKYMVRFDINITKDKFYTQMQVYLRPKKNINLEELKEYTKIGEPENASANFGSGEEYSYYFKENNNFTDINLNNIIIKRAISDWGSEYIHDKLLYNIEIKDNKYFDNCLIEFSNMMPENISNIKEIEELINKHDKIVENYLIIEKAIKSILFKNGIYIKYFIAKVDNLRLREKPSLNGTIIRNLNKDEKIELIEKGKEETINNIRGNWLKVKTKKNEIGWCFDPYLKEILY